MFIQALGDRIAGNIVGVIGDHSEDAAKSSGAETDQDRKHADDDACLARTLLVGFSDGEDAEDDGENAQTCGDQRHGDVHAAGQRKRAAGDVCGGEEERCECEYDRADGGEQSDKSFYILFHDFFLLESQMIILRRFCQIP